MRYLVLGSFLQDKPIMALEEHAEAVLEKLKQLLPNEQITQDTTGRDLIKLYDKTSGPTRRKLDTMILFPAPYAKRLLGHWEQARQADHTLQTHKRQNTEKIIATIAALSMLIAVVYTHQAYTILQSGQTLSNSTTLRAIGTVASFVGKLLVKLVN